MIDVQNPEKNISPEQAFQKQKEFINEILAWREQKQQEIINQKELEKTIDKSLKEILEPLRQFR